MRAADSGETFGPYLIDHRLGMGGMGVVYAATDQRLSRTVALKVISGNYAADDEFRARFHREAEVLARVDSPHIVQIYEHGEHAGTPYIATQFIRGGDLGEAISQHGAFPPPVAAHVCAQVADALQDAHEAGVIHRDVKPANVLLRNANLDQPHVYLCDFGIAQTESRGFTATGGVVGTWTYLSPERINGAPATPASDIYALGCLLWACLTGTAPYAGSDIQVAMAHVNAPVPQLTGQDPLSQALNGVLARALAKDPGQRYATAAQLRQDLQQLRQPRWSSSEERPQPVAPGPPPSRSKAPLIVLGIGALVLLTVLGAGGYVGFKVLNGGFGSEEPNRTEVPNPAGGPDRADTDKESTDYDGDGNGDIAFRDITASGATSYTAMSDGRSSFGTAVGEEAVPQSQLLRGDFNGDDRIDRVTITAPGKVDSATVGIAWGGTVMHTPDKALKLGAAHEYTAGVTGDYDGDGNDDLALVTGEATGPAELWVALSNGARMTFGKPTSWGTTSWDVDRTRFLGGHFDDEDGADLAVVTVAETAGDPATIEILANDGDSFESTEAAQEIDPAGEVTPLPLAGDFDGDDNGLGEIALYGAGGISVLQVDGGTIAGRDEWQFADRDLSHTQVTASDVDGDGDDDLVGFRMESDHWNIDVLAADGGSFGTPVTWGRYECPGGACTIDSLGVVDRS